MIPSVKNFLFATFIYCTLATSVFATTINSTATSISASRWRYDYVITNDTLNIPLQEISIFFDVEKFSALQLDSVPAAWDVLIVQPDLAIPADGFVDLLDLDAGLATQASVRGLSVSFDYLGTGTPGAQRFSVLNPLTFEELENGMTRGTEIPVPPTSLLLAIGWMALAKAKTRGRDRYR